MRVRLDPPIADWPTPTPERPIITGHQQTLYHPGILAKYIAADVATSVARGLSPGAVGCDGEAPRAKPGANGYAHVVVDQDVYDPMALDVPLRRGDRLVVERRPLARVMPDVPPASQPPVSSDEVREALATIDWPTDAAVASRDLLDAYTRAQGQPTLAAQAAAVNDALLQQVGVAPPRAVFASQMLADETHAWVLDALLHDASRSTAIYNHAVAAQPAAGMTPLRVEPDRIEVPLWWLADRRPRQRVFVDIADSTPWFITEDGEPIDATGAVGRFAPRALLMTALLRKPDHCSLFIHGTGGWAYDRITEAWWRQWRGEELAPMALATADVHLDFDAPVAERGDLRRAVWYRHHVKDNVDRYAGADPALVARKRELLAHMDDDRDRKRRRAAFDEVHRINDQLVRDHPGVIAEADGALAWAEAGVANRRIAQRRDWFFGLYPQTKLDDLKAALESCLVREKCP